MKKMLKTRKEINDWLEEYEIEATINDDLTVDVYDDVLLRGMNLKFLPIQFGLVDGDFYIDSNELETLEGCPHTINGYFVALRNKITTLKGAPNYVRDSCFISENNLTSLQFLPKFIGNILDFSHNQINQILDTQIEFDKLNHVALSEEEKLKGFESLYLKLNHKTETGGDIFFLELSKEVFLNTKEKSQLENEIPPSSIKTVKKVKL